MKASYKEIRLDPEKVRELYKKALGAAADNMRTLTCFPRPVLTTGPGYTGIWQEHNHDSLLYADYDMEAAVASHDIFYAFQREDGLMPAMIHYDRETLASAPGYGQIQIVYPLAASAYEIYRKGGGRAFLERSYDACLRYDEWLTNFRDTRGTGLVEMFCEYDTGMDNSPRVTDGGIPHACPGREASVCPESDILPILAPDLSACRYRALRALADMARALGKEDEAREWDRKAEKLKQKIYEICYDEKDDFFYDVDRTGAFRRYRTEHILRLFLCGVVDREDFDRIYEKHILDPSAFGTPYPFPSVALSDPGFRGDRLANNWGGMSQAHSALETLFWMRQYGREEDFRGIASIWMKKWLETGTFTQEMHPVTGVASDCAPHFTTSLLAFVKFAEALGYVDAGKPS